MSLAFLHGCQLDNRKPFLYWIRSVYKFSLFPGNDISKKKNIHHYVCLPTPVGSNDITAMKGELCHKFQETIHGYSMI